MLLHFNEMWKPVLVMIIVNLAMAFVNVFMKKVINEGMDHLTILTYRQAISAIFLAPIAFFYERVTLSQYLFLVGLEYTSATLSCAFLNTVPVFTFIIALPLGMEKVSMKSNSARAKVLGTLVCISGTLLLILYKGMPLINPQSHHIEDKATATPSASNLKKWIIGSMFLTAACLFWSSWFLIQDRVGKKYPYQYSSTAILSLFASIQCAILHLIIQRNNAKWILKGKLQIMAIVYSGLVGSGLCYVAMSWCVKQRGPVFTAAFTPLIQMFVTVLDLCILQEQIYLGSFVGSILVISGMYILLWGKSKERKQNALKDTEENQKDEEWHNSTANPTTNKLETSE
ncbi:WAT1-related protein At3g30340-like isoform X2 [Cicer arietinum]|uniref:WAT1-related protein n=1 Tax=Cicer arietinum TaxID=3827 RepID=A0A3Q7YEH7_CICAR|nr:WAT1-related protein At3g30340-like isoform X2 [Cicer arietinum]